MNSVRFFKEIMRRHSRGLFSSEEAVTYRVFRRFLKIRQRKDAVDDGLNEASEPTLELSSEFFRWVVKRLKKARMYHKAFTLFEKQFLNLCIFCKPKLKSVKFLRAIGKILGKVEFYLKGFNERMIEKGKLIAERISIVVCSWGNRDAVKWKYDKSFMFYLGLIKHSSEGSWRAL
ncbi:MAG: hypothetical protein H3Z53_08750 [archaeon]|nr:hypothetical protein [archaeon]MCP8314441.1 hypothetical protein [archaeon]MCP8317210.1 hypothetical protein [archaeon]MCP8319353.1 hypothetical protein [archaeon]